MVGFWWWWTLGRVWGEGVRERVGVRGGGESEVPSGPVWRIAFVSFYWPRIIY